MIYTWTLGSSEGFFPSFLHHDWLEYIQHSYTLEFSECLNHTFCQRFFGLIWAGKKEACQCQKHFPELSL